MGDPTIPAKIRKQIKKDIGNIANDFIEYEFDEEEPQITPEINEAVDLQGRAINLNPQFDTLINAEIQL